MTKSRYFYSSSIENQCSKKNYSKVPFKSVRKFVSKIKAFAYRASIHNDNKESYDDAKSCLFENDAVRNRALFIEAKKAVDEAVLQQKRISTFLTHAWVEELKAKEKYERCRYLRMNLEAQYQDDANILESEQMRNDDMNVLSEIRHEQYLSMTRFRRSTFAMTRSQIEHRLGIR